jgi:hypothetical protein
MSRRIVSSRASRRNIRGKNVNVFNDPKIDGGQASIETWAETRLAISAKAAGLTARYLALPKALGQLRLRRRGGRG